jgi:nitrate reductase NapE component
MNHKNFIIDAVGNRKMTEKLSEEVVHFHIILLLYFTLKAVELVQVFAFVVASCHEHMLGVCCLPSQEGNDHLN